MLLNKRWQVLFVVLVHAVLSSGQPFATRIYTANDGLPDSYTSGIYQDKAGYLWIGTYTGLSRFDGQTFTTIKTRNQSMQISANVLLEDHHGRLWIFHNKTVCQLGKDSITCFPTSDGRAIQYVFGMVQLKDKRILALVDLGAYEFADTSWKKIDFPAPYQGLNCRQIIETEEGRYYNFQTCIALEKKDGTFTMLHPGTPESFFINIQKSGNALYANKVNGMIKIEGRKVTDIFREQLSQTTNYNFLIDHRRRFWIATEKYGILVSEPGNESYLPHTVSLPFNLSTYLFEDRDHTMWATNYEGLIKIKEINYSTFNASVRPEYENIRCIVTDRDGALYFATAGKGVFKLGLHDSIPDQLNFSKVPDLLEDVVDGMGFDKQGGLWIITRDARLYRYHNDLAEDLTHLLPLNTDWLRAIVFDSVQGKIILSSHELLIGDEAGFNTHQEVTGMERIAEPRYLLILKDGSLLVSTINSGVFWIRKDHTIQMISEQLGLHSTASEVKFYEDPVRGVWITQSGGGISKFVIEENDVFKKICLFTTQNGLPNNTIISAGFDARQRLWMTTLSGMAIISKTDGQADKEYRIETIGEELGRTVLNWGPSGLNLAYDGHGHVWVSTFHELFQFNALKNTSKVRLPGITIENVQLNFRETDWSVLTDSLTGYFLIPHNPALNYNQNSLAISFKGISYTEKPGLQYSYYLVRRDEMNSSVNSYEWSNPSASNDVSFISLPPGQYEFAVRAKEIGTDWSEPASFRFSIRPPFWMTWWFRSLLITGTLICIWLIVRFRERRLRRKADVNQQLHELEMKALKSQMNPHFIYNALNSIQSLVMDGKQEQAVKYMSRFARLLRQVLEHSGANLISLEKELSMIDIYVQLEMLRMNVKLNYEVNMDDQILPEKEYVPPLILQPFIENALWHGLSRKEGEKTLRMEINSDEDWLYITITDNGIGRQRAEELKSGTMDYPKSMGMEITGKRLQAVNAVPTYSFEIHDLRDLQGNAAGTQVQLKLRRKIQARNGNHS